MKLLEEGTARKLQWTSRSFCALLSACGEKSALEVGERVHSLALNHKAANGLEYQDALLSMYAGCGQLTKARALFDQLRQDGLADVVSYTAMVRCLAQAGNLEDPLSLIKEASQLKISLDGRFFAAVLSACGKRGAPELGKRVHKIAQEHNAADGV